MWGVAKVITSILNLVVSAYVMNQSNGHWLLWNALTKTITFTMEMEIALLQLFNGLEIFNLLKTEILFLHKNMRVEVIKIIKIFFGVFEVFWCTTCLKHDGYHVGSTFQGFVHCENLVGH
jgi:hypothetical protein